MESLGYATNNELPPILIEEEESINFESGEYSMSAEKDETEDISNSFKNGTPDANRRAQELLNDGWHFDLIQDEINPSNDRIANGELIYNDKEGNTHSRTKEIIEIENPDFTGSHEAMLTELSSAGFHELPSFNDGTNTFLTITYTDTEGYLFYLTLRKEAPEEESIEEQAKKIETEPLDEQALISTDRPPESSFAELLRNWLHEQQSEAQENAEIDAENLIEQEPLFLSLEIEQPIPEIEGAQTNDQHYDQIKHATEETLLTTTFTVEDTEITADPEATKFFFTETPIATTEQSHPLSNTYNIPPSVNTIAPTESSTIITTPQTTKTEYVPVLATTADGNDNATPTKPSISNTTKETTQSTKEASSNKAPEAYRNEPIPPTTTITTPKEISKPVALEQKISLEQPANFPSIESTLKSEENHILSEEVGTTDSSSAEQAENIFSNITTEQSILLTTESITPPQQILRQLLQPETVNNAYTTTELINHTPEPIVTTQRTGLLDRVDTEVMITHSKDTTAEQHSNSSIQESPAKTYITTTDPRKIKISNAIKIDRPAIAENHLKPTIEPAHISKLLTTASTKPLIEKKQQPKIVAEINTESKASEIIPRPAIEKIVTEHTITTIVSAAGNEINKQSPEEPPVKQSIPTHTTQANFDRKKKTMENLNKPPLRDTAQVKQNINEKVLFTKTSKPATQPTDDDTNPFFIKTETTTSSVLFS